MSSREDLVTRYLAQALDARERGRVPDLEALCAEHPGVVPEVAAALRLQDAMPEIEGIGLDPEQPPRLLAGRYRLVDVLGQGASGLVWLGRDLELDRDVAVKVLRSGILVGEQAEQRFLRESEVLARLEHPHVVRVYDRGKDAGGDLFLVTERLHGCNLLKVLEAAGRAMPQGASAAGFRDTGWLREVVGDEAVTEPTALRQLARWMLELAMGLQAAHSKGVFHRDVKPSNSWVRSTGGAVVLDFGLAVRAGDPALTVEGALLGTPWYMAPEQAVGKARPHPTVDVYGLCATLYHLVTLRPPHAGDLGEVLASLRERDPVPAGRLHPGLPRDLQAILDRGLERDPGRRYPEVAALAGDLQALLDARPVLARPIGPVGRAVRRARRRPARAAAMALGALTVLLLVVGVPLWQREVAASERAERNRLFVSQPSQLAIEGWPDHRLLQPLDERQGYLADLDRLLELDPEDVPTRLLRASLRLDGADHAGAREDLEELAARSPYLEAVAQRYAEADDSRAGIEAVILADLPEPASTEDGFVAGFHALRARDGKRALELLDAAVEADPEYLPARDLRLLALLDQGKGTLARDEANHLEGRYGGPTARTRHAIGVALLLERKYRDAIPVFQQALELRPGRHGPLINLATALLRTGRPDEAERYYREAIAVRPWFDNTHSGLAQALNRLERFDEARAEARLIQEEALRHLELGNVDLYEAIVSRQTGTADHRAPAASAARSFADSIGADPTHRGAGLARVSELLARALADDSLDKAIEPLLLLMRAAPHDTNSIFNLVVLLRDQELDGYHLALLRLYLVEFALSLSPDEERLLSLRQEILDDLRRMQTEPK